MKVLGRLKSETLTLEGVELQLGLLKLLTVAFIEN